MIRIHNAEACFMERLSGKNYFSLRICNLCIVYVQAWKEEGLPLSTSSDEAAKMLHATLWQVEGLVKAWYVLINQYHSHGASGTILQ